MSGSVSGGNRAIRDWVVQSVELHPGGWDTTQFGQQNLPGDSRPNHYPVASVGLGGKQTGVSATDESGEIFLICGLNNSKARRIAGYPSDGDGGVEAGAEGVEGPLRIRSAAAREGEDELFAPVATNDIVGPDELGSICANRARARSPAGCPWVSFSALKWSRSAMTSDMAVPCERSAVTSFSKERRFNSPVRASVAAWS
jgi:hypothetical protein